MATVQFLSFLANLVAAMAIWKLPGLEENKRHLQCNMFVDWWRDSVLRYSVHLHPVPKLVFSYRVYNVPASFPSITRPLYYRNQVTYPRVQKAFIVGLLWPCAHFILPVTGFGKFRLYRKGIYSALDLTTETK